MREPVLWCSTRGQGKPLNDKELRWLVREQGIAAVPHGFRSSFRDWAAEETDHPREVIEAALAHVVRNPGRGGLCPLRPVRAPACPDGRLGALPGPGDRLPATKSSKATSPGAGQVEQDNPAPGLQRFGLPAGITMVRATSPQGGKRVSFSLSPFTLPRAAPAAKKGGSLSPPAPLSCGAPLRPGEGGHARRSLASLFRNGREESVPTRV